jgi:polysaccharide export outer membrane protein
MEISAAPAALGAETHMGRLFQMAFVHFAARMRALAVLLLMITAPTAALAQAQQGYLLGPHDSITVIVYGQNEFNVQTRIKPDGSIVMPLIGKVQAQGKTVITLADEITRKLTTGNFLRDPIVNVEINEYTSRFARVAGKVGTPGLIPIDRSYRVLNVLLRAGWVRDGGADYVLLRRADDNKEVRISTEDLARGGPQSDLIVQAGDTLYVADAELIYITGAVNRPGGYPLKPGMTVSELLAMAGGVSQTGSANRVGLRRDGATRETDADGQTKLQKGDIINVRERLF